MTANGHRISLGRGGNESVLKLDFGCNCITLNILKNTESYTANDQITCYVNYVLLKLLKKSPLDKMISLILKESATTEDRSKVYLTNKK